MFALLLSKLSKIGCPIGTIDHSKRERKICQLEESDSCNRPRQPFELPLSLQGGYSVAQAMVFKRSMFQQGPNEPLSEDRFSQVELATAFKKLTCYHCDFEAIYKYYVQQVRRNSEIRVNEGDEISIVPAIAGG